MVCGGVGVVQIKKATPCHAKKLSIYTQSLDYKYFATGYEPVSLYKYKNKSGGLTRSKVRQKTHPTLLIYQILKPPSEVDSLNC